jgi:hypothetical protein
MRSNLEKMNKNETLIPANETHNSAEYGCIEM